MKIVSFNTAFSLILFTVCFLLSENSMPIDSTDTSPSYIQQKAAESSSTSINKQAEVPLESKPDNSFPDQFDAILIGGIAILAIAGQRPLALVLFIVLLFKQFS